MFKSGINSLMYDINLNKMNLITYMDLMLSLQNFWRVKSIQLEL